MSAFIFVLLVGMPALIVSAVFVTAWRIGYILSITDKNRSDTVFETNIAA